ncbi:MAG: TonB-dependent receptor, partial [Pseudomonadota bacterium]|nr:TonB-dependent receptor [Pseudomonadota bacterium]
GSDALAAVVYIKTANSKSADFINFIVEAGENDSSNLSVNGFSNKKNWSINYNLSQLNTNGTNVSRNGNENDDSDLLTAGLMSNLKYNENLSINLGARYVKSTTEFDDTFTTGIPIDADLFSDSKQIYLDAGVEKSFPQIDVLHKFNIRHLGTERKDFNTGAEMSESESNRTTLSYQADLQLGMSRLSIALEHERNSFNDELNNLPNQDQSMNVNSAVADLHWVLNDQLTALSSLRLDKYSDFKDALTGRIALSFRLRPETKFRASLGTGQKIPTFTERFGYSPLNFIGNPNLKSEKSISYEFGIEKLYLDNSLEFEITYFKSILEDEINGFVPIIIFPDNQEEDIIFASTAENIINKSHRQGIEINSRYRADKNIELGFSYTYTDSTFENLLGNDIREIRRPRHNSSISANYKFANNRANFFLVANYNGSQIDNVFLPPNFLPEGIKLDNYWLVNATLKYNLTNKINIFTRFSNLLDKNFEDIYGFNTQDRAIYAGILFEF